MDGDVPVAPAGFSGSLSVDKGFQSLGVVALLDGFELPILLLDEAVTATVGASGVCIEPDREIA
nr:hypothetical protein [Anaerotruncus colihominis]